MLSSTFIRATVNAAARNGSKKSPRYLSTIETDSKGFSSKTSDEIVDPMEIFDSIDANGDGVLSRQEFAVAVEKMHFVSMHLSSTHGNSCDRIAIYFIATSDMASILRSSYFPYQ